MIDPQAPDFSSTAATSSDPMSWYRPRDGRGQRPAVSIVTAFAGGEDVFHETARSILRQSFQLWEWLIVHDVSAGTRGTLDRYREHDLRIRGVDAPPGRALGAWRNAGARAAHAAYVCFLDVGDLLEPTALEKCLWHLATHPELAFANGWSVALGARPALGPRGFDDGETFRNENPVSGPFLVRARAHADVGGFDEMLPPGLDEWDYWLRHADRGRWGATIREYLGRHRRRDGPVEHDHAAAEFRRAARERYPRLFEDAFPRIASRPQSAYETVSVAPVLDNPLDKPAGVRRVLLLYPRLIVGGADRFVIDLVAQLTARGNEMTMCTTLDDDNPWLPRVTRVTPDVFALATFIRPPDWPRFLLYLIDSRGIDVVIVSHSYLGYQLLPFLRAHRPEIAYVDYSHIEAEHWNSGGYPRAAVACQELIDLTVVSTHHLKDWMVGRGAQAARIEVVHTNVDTDHWRPDPALGAAMRSELGVGTDVAVVLLAARLSARKQPHVFAEVVRRLAADVGGTFACVVAGDGEGLPALRAFVADHRLEACVQLLGWVSPERMRALQAAADIFFLPSRLEGLSVALYEAMAMASVPVSARVGGQAELVTPECGVLVAPGDGEVEAYVEALRRLISSPALRTAMGAAARRRVVESFSLDAMGERMCEALSRAGKLRLTEPRPAVGRGLGLETATLAIEYARLDAAFSRLQPSPPTVAATQWSAHELSRHLGARMLLKALVRRLAWRSAALAGWRARA